MDLQGDTTTAACASSLHLIFSRCLFANFRRQSFQSHADQRENDVISVLTVHCAPCHPAALAPFFAFASRNVFLPFLFLFLCSLACAVLFFCQSKKWAFFLLDLSVLPRLISLNFFGAPPLPRFIKKACRTLGLKLLAKP